MIAAHSLLGKFGTNMNFFQISYNSKYLQMWMLLFVADNYNANRKRIFLMFTKNK